LELHSDLDIDQLVRIADSVLTGAGTEIRTATSIDDLFA